MKRRKWPGSRESIWYVDDPDTPQSMVTQASPKRFRSLFFRRPTLRVAAGRDGDGGHADAGSPGGLVYRLQVSHDPPCPNVVVQVVGAAQHHQDFRLVAL